MKKLALFIALLASGQSFSQQTNCFITVSPLDTTVCPGSPVTVNVLASILNANQSFDFNTASIPSGWTTQGGLGFTPSCAPPSPDGTDFYWASTSAAGVEPGITSAAFDINCPGGYITFEMIYASGGASPCEELDLYHEGVALEYSIDGGATWVTINYWAWNGDVLTSVPTSNTPAFDPALAEMSVWNSFTVPIPSAANTTNTMFRWYQPNPSGNSFDNWGLDNIVINAMGGNCSAGGLSLIWSNGLTGNQNTLAVGAPGIDSTFVIDVYDSLGVLQCTSSPVTIHTYDDNLNYNLQDYAYSYCPTTNPMVQVTNISGAIPPYSVLWTDAPTSTNNPYALSTGGAEHDSITYHVTISDGCGFERQDSVTLVVNKLLNIDSLVAYDASSCLTDGAVVAYVSGLTTNNNQPFYNWHGPGATNPSFINSTVWTNRSPGWYYFTVTDDVCTDSDSVLVSVKNAPVAIIDADPLAGCAPFDVTFENNSENSTHYTWNFGDGTVINENAMNSHNHTYSGNAMITLIAYDDANCSDTAYVNVSVQTCGCTDPLAINYDPTAVQNDGSCLFPEPTFEVPNIFTPNGDGENDFFEFVVTNYSNIEFSVVNRWGNTVFQGSGMNPKWDGKVDGVIPSDGVYFITYKITGLKGDKVVEGQTFVHLVQ